MDIFSVIVALILLAIILLREVKQYERGVVLTMGRFTSLRGPGWTVIVPVFQKME